MGFPVGYSELPGLLLHAIFLLGHVRRLISWTFDTIGLGDLIDSDAPCPDPPAGGYQHIHHQSYCPELRPLPALLIDEILPVILYESLGRCSSSHPESCAVCLHELEGREDVRQLSNCRHAFHRWCLDRWIAHGQHTCPLCRSPLFPAPPTTHPAAVADGTGASDYWFDDDDDSYSFPASSLTTTTPLLSI